MPVVDLVLFDLDGTLIETAPEICDAVNDLMAHYGWQPVDESQIERWIGHGTGKLLLHAVADALGVTTDVLHGSGRMSEVGARYDSFYERRCGTRSRLYPGVRETLAALRASGIKCAIVTNKERRYTDRLVSAHALTDQFDRVMCGDTMPAPKPDPAGVRDYLREARVSATRALFVGDSSIDAATARHAGLPVWLVPGGYNLGQPVTDAGADRILDGIASLHDQLHDGAVADTRGDLRLGSPA